MQQTYKRPPCFVSKEIADEAERQGEHDKPLTWEDLTVDQCDKAVQALAAKAEDAPLVWVHATETRVINLDVINRAVAEDVVFACKLVELVLSGNGHEAGNQTLEKFNEAAQELIQDAMDDYCEPPKGYTLEGLL